MRVWSLARRISALHAVVGALEIRDDQHAITEGEESLGWYQSFIDYHPVSRFNQLNGLERKTLEGGVHKFPGVRGLRPPALIKRFDWALLGDGLGHQRSADPHTVWAEANPPNLKLILDVAEKQFRRAGADRVLVLGDSDMWLSEVFANIPTAMSDDANPAVNPLAVASYKVQRFLKKGEINAVVARLHKFFGRIFYEAKDMKVDGIRTMPIGLTEFFLRNGVAESAAEAIRSARLDNKPGTIKGAFSFYHDLEHCGRGWGEGQALRQQAKAWSKSAAARGLGVDSNVTEANDWWGAIAKYRFIMAPNGCGVQTPKQVEALSVLTIPIARRGPYPVWDDLVSYGFPIVVVDEWSDITPPRLDEWWAKLSPRLASFRDNCLTTEGYWRLFTGQREFCE